MLASERHDMIVEMVNRDGSVVVKELAKQFDVTLDSIRKDLTILEKKGLLKKTYGGAVSVRKNQHELYVSQRIGKHTEEKQRIAKKALELIEEGDVIFLDISTSNLELVKLIAENDLQVTIVTNMTDVMLTFVNGAAAKLIFLGGSLNRGKDGFTGTYTINQIREFHFDKAFLGTVGVDIGKNCAYTYEVDDAMTKKAIMEASSVNYLMLENNKLDKDGNYRCALISDYTGIIFDSELQEEQKKALESLNVDIYIGN